MQWFDRDWGKNQRLVRKSRFLQIYEYLIKDLIDTNGSRGKVAQYDKSYQMICILCGYVKHHVITEPKIKLAPTSGRFLSKFLQTFRAMSWTCPSSFVLIDLY